MNPNVSGEYQQRLGERQPYGTVQVNGRDIRPLTKDEIELWNGCLKRGFYVLGVPAGIAGVILRSFYNSKVGPYQATPAPQQNIKSAIVTFGLNCLVGCLFYSPVCYQKLRERFLENEKKFKSDRVENINVSGGSDSTIGISDDFQNNFDLKLDGPQGSFSHLNLDINSPIVENIQSQDENISDSEKKIKPPETTYEELRWRNRSNFLRPPPQPRQGPHDSGVSNQNVSDAPSRPTQDIKPPRPKNKYGDDME